LAIRKKDEFIGGILERKTNKSKSPVENQLEMSQ